jgi:tetratricopeptide (TPR) repeat protein
MDATNRRRFALVVAAFALALSSSRVSAQELESFEKLFPARANYKPSDMLKPNVEDRKATVSARYDELLRGAQAAHDAHDYQAAIRITSLILKDNPMHVAALQSRAQAYTEAGQFNLAFTDADLLVRLTRNLYQPYLIRGSIQAKRNRNDLALADYHRAVTLAPDAIEPYCFRALAYYERQDYRLALADYDEANRLGEASFGLFATRGMCHAELGEHVQAVVDLTEALRREPLSSPCSLRRGCSYLELHKVDLAIQDFTSAIKASPNHPEAYYSRACAYSEKHLYDEAIADLDDAIRLDPGSPSLKVIRSEIVARKQSGYKSDGLLARVTTALPKEAIPAIFNALVPRDGDDAAKVLERLDKIVKEYPNSPHVYLVRGHNRGESGDEEGEMSDYDKALAINPNLVEALTQRAALFDSRKEFGKAIADIEKAVRIDYQNERAALARGIIRADQGDFDGAIAEFSRSIKNRGSTENRPNDPSFVMQLSICPRPCDAYIHRTHAYLSKRDFDKALADSEEVVRLAADRETQRSEAYLLRATVHKARNKIDSAREDARQALESAKDDDDRADAQKLLDEIGKP